MPELFETLRSQIHESRDGKHFGAIRYSADLRERILAHVQSEIATGRKLPEITKTLGITIDTVKRWQRPPESKKAMRPVIVTAEKQLPSRCVIISPAGYRVEGLSAEDVTSIMGVLG